jgi:hypothetical protein
MGKEFFYIFYPFIDDRNPTVGALLDRNPSAAAI